jgi:cytochrome c553
MMVRNVLPLGLLGSLALFIYAADAKNPASIPEKVQYNRDVRPILAANCFACHGADSAARKADLRLDQRDVAVERGAIAPGKISESEMIERIMLPADDDHLMPPAKTHKTLKSEEKEILKRWIAQGAEYQPHWSFIPPVKPSLPARGESKLDAWPRNAIDRFVLAEMEKHGLAPNPEADRRTLARRLSLDLIGLPPDPADVEEFVNDKSDGWYEKYVDKLMASPHWGEHRGRYWLDAARYADTHGIHFDNFREMYSYRDWVINAFNKNQPFDQFTIDQLAGDLEPNATLDQKVATGFNRCNITTNEGGLIDEEYLVLYTRDRTETASQVWMGLTTGCAVCHDHKFDPISQKDFYSLAAFFNNTTQGARDGNIPNTPPVMPVPRAEDRAKWATISKRTAELRDQLAARKKQAAWPYAWWLPRARPEVAAEMVPENGLVFHAELDEGRGKEIIATVNGELEAVNLTDGYTWVADKQRSPKALAVRPGEGIAFPDVGDFKASQPYSAAVWVKPTKRGLNGAVLARMDDSKGAVPGWDIWLQNDRVATHLIDTWPSKTLKVAAKQPLPLNQWTHITITYDGSAKAGGLRIFYNGEPQPSDTEVETLSKTDNTRTKAPFKLGQRNSSSRVQNLTIGDVRVYDRQLSFAESTQLAKGSRAAEILAKPAAKRSPAEKDALYEWWLMSFDRAYKDLVATQDSLQRDEVAIKSRGTVALISNEKPSMPEAYLLNRGEYDQRRDKLAANTPKSLPAFPSDLPKNRLGFAKWLLRPEHPLTARVTVNRFWQELFGTGLVRTAGDFGVTGTPPSHPELLDWLALEFQSHWDVKKFFKLLVTSATYRQSSVVTKEKLEADPANTWLARGPRYRMDAEMVRDYALAASGLLVEKIGGPSVKPYQPDGVWEAVAMLGSDTRNYKRDSGEKLYRRSLYTFWKRAAPPASMEVLNAPNRETCTVHRERTNTPLQALLTLNDVQFVEAARVLAERTLKSSEDDAKRLDYLAKRLLARPWREEELKIVKNSLAGLMEEYQEDPDAAKMLIAFGESKADAKLDVSTLAAWTMLANQLMNLDEVLNK